MSTDCESTPSTGNVVPSTGNEPETTTEQLQCVNDLRHWVENEAEFYGRTDEEFLLMYLRACKFDLEKTRRRLKSYYETRKKVPQWWANRDLRDECLQSLIQLKASTIIIDKEPHQPVVLFYSHSRLERHSGNFDHYLKLFCIMTDIAFKRRNCQLNGFILIVDCRDYPAWFMYKLLSPTVIRNSYYSFISSRAVRVKKLICLNIPLIGLAVVKLLMSVLSHKLRQRVVIYGSRWPTLSEHVPLELLPEEYGGTAGPMKEHDDSTLREILSFTDYLADDNKYGFQ